MVCIGVTHVAAIKCQLELSASSVCSPIKARWGWASKVTSLTCCCLHVVSGQPRLPLLTLFCTWLATVLTAWWSQLVGHLAWELASPPGSIPRYPWNGSLQGFRDSSNQGLGVMQCHFHNTLSEVSHRTSANSRGGDHMKV